MRMRFTADDESAFHRTQDALTSDFAGWAGEHDHPGDPSDVELLLDWKWGYGDGDLSRWPLADIEEFLLGWCPRKLAAPPDLYARLPTAVAGFVEFLADRGRLSPGGPTPAAVRERCAAIAPRFVREMGDPTNFGMAKSLFAGLDDGGDDDHLLAELGRLTGEDPDTLAELLEAADDELRLIGPVRLPGRDEHLGSVRAASAFRQVRDLARSCAKPGLTLTPKGNLRLADARRLVTELATGDEIDEEHGKLRSAEELPGLSRLVDLALAVGAVRRQRGRLVAVASFAALDDTDAHDRLVRAAVEAGLAPVPGYYMPALRPLYGLVDGGAERVLLELLDAAADGEPDIPVESVHELFDEVLTHAFPGFATMTVPGLGPLRPVIEEMLRRQVAGMLERLVDLGVATLSPAGSTEHLALTPAGVAVCAGLVADLPGVQVVQRPDPASADAATMAETLPMLGPEAAEADLASWVANRPDADTAATELLTALTYPDRPTIAVLAGLDTAGAVFGARAEAAARTHLDGPHDAVLVAWLLGRGALALETVGTARALTGVVAVTAAFLDAGGPESAIDFIESADHTQVVELLEGAWRLDHPGVAGVLDAIGAHHPDRRIAKLARKNLMKFRNRVAQA